MINIRKTWGVLLILLFAAALLVSLFVLQAKTTDKVSAADLTATEEFEGGTGTAEDPYLIANAFQLNKVREVMGDGVQFKLTSDIDLLPLIGEKELYTDYGWLPFGVGASAFRGVFDGDGYEIKNLWINRTGDSKSTKNNGVGASLFGYSLSVTIKNLGIRVHKSGVTGYSNVAAFAGTLRGESGKSSSIQNCYVTGDENGEGFIAAYNQYGSAGAVVGSVSTTINNCYSAIRVTAPAYAGGIASSALNGADGSYSYPATNISNCFSLSNVRGNSDSGGILGNSNGNYYMRTSYAVGLVENAGSGLSGKGSSGSITSSYACYETTKQSRATYTNYNTSMLIQTAKEMQYQATFAGFDFESVWGIEEGNGFPYLKSINALTAQRGRNTNNAISNTFVSLATTNTADEANAAEDSRFFALEFNDDNVANIDVATTASRTLYINARASEGGSLRIAAGASGTAAASPNQVHSIMSVSSSGLPKAYLVYSAAHDSFETELYGAPTTAIYLGGHPLPLTLTPSGSSYIAYNLLYTIEMHPDTPEDSCLLTKKDNLTYEFIPYIAGTFYLQYTVTSNDFAAVRDTYEITVLPGDVTGMNYTNLDNTLNDISALEENRYTSVTWSALQSVVAKAESMKSDNTALQFDIDLMDRNLKEAMLSLDPVKNFDALNEAIADAKSLLEEHYTSSSWNNLLSVIGTSEAVAANESSEQSLIDSTLLALIQAMDDLVPIQNLTNLAEALIWAESLTEENYTAASWSAMREKYLHARAIHDSPKSVQTQIDSAESELRQALVHLSPAPNFGNLQALVDEAEAFASEDFTASSWDFFYPKLLVAQLLLKNPNAKQSDIDSTTNVLRNAINSLVTRSDKTELINEIMRAESKLEHRYTQASWRNLQNALAAAISVRDSNTSTQTQVDIAAGTLKITINNLVAILNYELLDEAIKIAKGINTDLYEGQGVSLLETALSEAEALIALTDGVTQEMIDAAATSLNNAVISLVQKPGLADFSALNSLILEAESLIETDYTPSSWFALNSSLKNAKLTAGKLTASQKEIDSAKELLQNAIDYLVKTDGSSLPADVNLASLLKAIALAESYDSSEYTASSFAILTNMLSTARVVGNNATAMQSEVDLSLNNLMDAIKGLVKKPINSAPNTSGLAKALELAESYDRNEYTAASFLKLTAAINAAGNPPDYTQDTIDGLTVNLLDAIGALVRKPSTGQQTADLSALYNAIALAETLKKEDFTEESFNALTTALTEAKKQTQESSQEIVSDCLINLQNAQAALVPAGTDFIEKPDFKGLQLIIGHADSLKTDAFTEKSWAVMTEKLLDAKKLEGDANAAQEDIDAAGKALSEAINALQLQENKGAGGGTVSGGMLAAIIILSVAALSLLTGLLAVSLNYKKIKKLTAIKKPENKKINS